MHGETDGNVSVPQQCESVTSLAEACRSILPTQFSARPISKSDPRGMTKWEERLNYETRVTAGSMHDDLLFTVHNWMYLARTESASRGSKDTLAYDRSIGHRGAKIYADC